MPDEVFRPGEQHPEPWRNDLNPDRMAGQNLGMANPHPEQSSRTAYDVKDAHRMLEGITDDGLKQIPVLWEGTRLEQGGTYIDLRDPDRKEFTATGDMQATGDNWYVPKAGVDYELWNRLIGITNPERLYAAPTSEEHAQSRASR
jgi:hypothetical protein